MKLWAAALVLALAACGGGDADRIAAGTTLVDSGAVEALMDAYAGQGGGALAVVAGSSAESLVLAEGGEAVAALTHAPELEEAYVSAHPDAIAAPVFCSRFVIAGPDAKAAALDGLDPVEIMARIAGEKWPFVTRQDGSGTYSREVELWELAGIDPTEKDWYIATGQGMGATLQVADQRDAFVLAEVGVFMGAEGIEIVVVDAAGSPDLLANPYSIIVPDPEAPGAREFFEWMTSGEPLEVLAEFTQNAYGLRLYEPSLGG